MRAAPPLLIVCSSFQFKVSVRNLTLPEVFTFRITFVQLRLNIAANESVRVIADRIAFVNESHLKVTTEPLYVNSSVIVYTLTKEPKVSDFIVGLVRIFVLCFLLKY